MSDTTSCGDSVRSLRRRGRDVEDPSPAAASGTASLTDLARRAPEAAACVARLDAVVLAVRLGTGCDDDVPARPAGCVEDRAGDRFEGAVEDLGEAAVDDVVEEPFDRPDLVDERVGFDAGAGPAAVGFAPGAAPGWDFAAVPFVLAAGFAATVRAAGCSPEGAAGAAAAASVPAAASSRLLRPETRNNA